MSLNFSFFFPKNIEFDLSYKKIMLLHGYINTIHEFEF